MQPERDDRPSQRHQEAGCIGDIVGPITWPAAVVVVAIVLALLASDWLDDRDDARLDELRRTAIEQCGSWGAEQPELDDCVAATIKASGQDQ